ncbi:hypothetical protein DFJ73DRAFT_126226 [Zopfochytrium polystomum]|nr:hypothetical protein DFJ73DRAFT_126226 [Zopfochytrium polystomum]
MTTVPAASSSSSTSSSSTSPHYAHPASSTIDLLSPSSTSPSAAPTGTIGASSCGAVDLLTAPAQHQPPPPPLLQQEQSPHPQGKSRPLSRSNTVSKTVGSTEKSPEALISVTASKPSPAVSPAPLEQPSPVFSTSANTPQAAVTLAASSSSTPSTPTSASTHRRQLQIHPPLFFCVSLSHRSACKKRFAPLMLTQSGM